jgi:hypothetical protein
MSTVHPELVALCLEAKRADPKGGPPWEGSAWACPCLSDAAIALAVELYAKAVNFCAKADFPNAAIRVEMTSHGLRPTKCRVRPMFATVLRWNGGAWVATKEQRGGDKREALPLHGLFRGSAWVDLSSRPAAMFQAKKLPMQEIYSVKIASVSEQRGYAPRWIEPDPWGAVASRILEVGKMKSRSRQRKQASHLPRAKQKAPVPPLSVGATGMALLMGAALLYFQAQATKAASSFAAQAERAEAFASREQMGYITRVAAQQALQREKEKASDNGSNAAWLEQILKRAPTYYPPLEDDE